MKLTKRETQILVQIARGRAAKEIALDLKISCNTVKSHKHRIGLKLGLSGEAGNSGLAQRLTAWAYENGVILIRK